MSEMVRILWVTWVGYLVLAGACLHLGRIHHPAWFIPMVVALALSVIVLRWIKLAHHQTARRHKGGAP